MAPARTRARRSFAGPRERICRCAASWARNAICVKTIPRAPAMRLEPALSQQNESGYRAAESDHENQSDQNVEPGRPTQETRIPHLLRDPRISLRYRRKVTGTGASRAYGAETVEFLYLGYRHGRYLLPSRALLRRGPCGATAFADRYSDDSSPTRCSPVRRRESRCRSPFLP